MKVDKEIVEATGRIIVRKSRLSNYGRNRYYDTMDKRPYKSVKERKELMKMMCVKWHVDDIITFISVMPD